MKKLLNLDLNYLIRIFIESANVRRTLDTQKNGICLI